MKSIRDDNAPHRRDIRVLLIAEAANPEWASVPLEGWSHSRAIAQIAHAHVVTQQRNAAAFERAGLDSGDYTAIDSERIAGPMYRLGNRLGSSNGKGWTLLTALTSLSYQYFERLVWKRFGRQIASGQFDIVHRLTPLSPTVPSRLSGACRSNGVPFILGPLNGGVPWPSGFDTTRRQEREWLSYIRSMHRIQPGFRSTRKNAAAIIIGSCDTWTQMPQRYRDKCVYIPENGLDVARLPPTRTVVPRRPLRVVFVGRLVPYKGADMLVEAAQPLLRAGLMTLTIIGDGPQMPVLRRQVREFRIDDSVRLAGWMQHAAAQQLMATADVFAFPSIREFGGAVVLEAMAAGVVPIVVNYGGPGELVTERTGYRIPIGRRTDIIQQVRETLADITRNPAQLIEKSAAAQQRARTNFTWQRKAEQCLEVYRWVLGQRATKPNFGMPLPDAQPTESQPRRSPTPVAN